MTNNSNKVGLESLIKKEVSITNLRDWKRYGTIYCDDLKNYAFIYVEFSGITLCYLPLINQKDLVILDKNVYYLDFDKSEILKYSETEEDLDFTSNSIFAKYHLFLDYLKTVKGQ